MYYAYVNQNNCIEQIHSSVAEPSLYQQVSNCPSDLIAAPFVYRYKLIDGQAVARAQTEIDADIAAIPVSPPTQAQINAANIEYLAMMCEVELEV